jgi:L-lactate dehydrogenase
VLPVSSLQTGIHGMRDVCLSLPTIVDAGGADRVLEVPLSEDEAAGLAESAATLHNVQKSLGL